MFRNGLKRIIKESDELLVVGEACDGLELLDLLKNSATDMVILDISMPRLRGIEATHEIKSIYPQVKVLLLSMHKSDEYLIQALSARADGYLLKEDTDEELFSAIDTIRQEKIYLSPLLSEKVEHKLLDFVHGDDKIDRETLSLREREVLTLLSEGKSNKEIAELLFISTRTVEHHRASINTKLNIKNVVDLIKYAIRKGFTSP
jgi:DNA-binding NarL/FixJ family response regulator